MNENTLLPAGKGVFSYGPAGLRASGELPTQAERAFLCGGAHGGGYGPAHEGAGRMFDERLSTQAMRVHMERPYVLTHLRLFPFLECDSMVPDILSDRSERMSAKKGGAAARFRPKF